MYCCSNCNTEIKDNYTCCPVCGKSMTETTSQEQEIRNDERIRQSERNKNKLGCAIPVAFIMAILSFLIVFVLPGSTSFGGWMFVVITIYVVYSVAKTMIG